MVHLREGSGNSNAVQCCTVAIRMVFSSRQCCGVKDCRAGGVLECESHDAPRAQSCGDIFLGLCGCGSVPKPSVANCVGRTTSGADRVRCWDRSIPSMTRKSAESSSLCSRCRSTRPLYSRTKWALDRIALPADVRFEDKPACQTRLASATDQPP